MHTLVIFNPGHFHAALVLRETHPGLSRDVYVYSEPGRDVDRFFEIVDSFNNRPDRPTQWRIHKYTENDYLEKLISEKKGDIVILAGKNSTKMENIERMGRAGFAVLADKPWVTTEKAIPFLQAAMAEDRPPTMDIMTERYEITTRLQKAFLAEEEVFGRVRIDRDGEPSVYKESVHHLYKLVNQKPLIRPEWYFDIDIQGEGIVDTTTHLVDMIQWMLFPGTPIHYDEDIELVDARRWETGIPLEIYKKTTGADRFPDTILDYVEGDVLNYYCNGDLVYRLKGIPVMIRNIWNLEIPPGGGDTHRSHIKGARSDLMVRQLPEKGFKTELLIKPNEKSQQVKKAIQACLEKWSGEYPGLALTPEADAFLIDIPDGLRSTHEEHFCKVRDAYLESLDRGPVSAANRACIVSKYTLLAEARKKALASPFEMLPFKNTG